ncbi:MAG: CarD family transcriptional regulator [Cellulosilyticaceae bacterium]
MFQVGDQVFCPMRGSGIVEAIEEREMLGNIQEYFIIKLTTSGMTVMIPTEGTIKSKFRLISDTKLAEEVLDTLSDEENPIDKLVSIKERLKINQVKLKAGTFADCGEVIKSLTCFQKIKALNNSERVLLMDARKLFIDELSLIKAISKEEANSMLDSLLEN